MNLLNDLELIYYLGVVGLVVAVIMIMVQRFVEFDEIDLKQHWGIIIIYLVLLLLAIVLWRLVFDFFFGFADILNKDALTYKEILNG